MSHQQSQHQQQEETSLVPAPLSTTTTYQKGATPCHDYNPAAAG